jgi:hypothetical protein
MEGDDRVRHCCDCRLNVYNVAEMEREEVIRLIQQKEGRLCFRMHRRQDGTLITRDCPTGLRAVRRKIAVALVCACSLFASVVAYAFGATHRGGKAAWIDIGMPIGEASWRDNLPSPLRTVVDKLDPPPAVPEGTTTLGDVVDTRAYTTFTSTPVSIPTTIGRSKP